MLFAIIKIVGLSLSANDITFLAAMDSADMSPQSPYVSMPRRTEVFVIGDNPWRENEREAVHHHRGSEWNLIVQGSAQRLIGSEVVHLQAGSLLHVPTDVSHAMIESSANLRFWVVWQPTAVAAAAGARRLANTESSLLRQHCELIAHHRENELVCEPLVRALLAWLPQAWLQGTVINTTGHPAVAEAVQRMHAANGRIDFTELAAQVGLSRSRLGHAFREHLGTSLAAYRTRCRLQYFDQIRERHPDYGLVALAREAGFTNYMQFYRAHVKARGTPPSDGHSLLA